MPANNLGVTPAENWMGMEIDYPSLVGSYLNGRLSNNSEVFKEAVLNHVDYDKTKLAGYLENSPWTISVSALPVILGRKHLYLTIASEEIDYIFMRMDGVPAHPKLLSQGFLDLGNVTPTGVLDGSILFGVLTPPENVFKSPSIFHDRFYDESAVTRDSKKITVFRGGLETVMNFMSVAAQFFVALDVLQQPYQLLGTNSNSVVGSLLKYGLGDQYDPQAIRADLEKEGWVFPGYDNLLLPGAKFRSYAPPASEASRAKAIELSVATGKTSGENVCDRDEEVRIRGLLLAEAMLRPFHDLFDIVERPGLYNDRARYVGPLELPKPVRINSCPSNAFPVPVL